jgi:Terpene cyclase DEP1
MQVGDTAASNRASKRRQAIYLALSLLGAALPLSQFLPWVVDHGLDLPRLRDELFANRISSFFGVDLLISAVVVLTFLALDGGGLSRSHRVLTAVATCLVGVSCGLPVYLLLQERNVVNGPRSRPAAVG